MSVFTYFLTFFSYVLYIILDIGYCLFNYAYACKFYTTEIECCSDPVEEHMKYKCNMVITNMKMLAPRCSVLLAASLIKSDY